MGQIFFFTNHEDITFLKSQFPGDKIDKIKHPYLDPEWTEEQVIEKCKNHIDLALSAEKLIITGEYFLVSYIVTRRMASGKSTGFISFKKENIPDGTRGKDEKITYKNVLKPVGIRWLRPI